MGSSLGPSSSEVEPPLSLCDVPLTESLSDTQRRVVVAEQWLFTAKVVLLAPLTEEVLFRCLILRNLIVSSRSTRLGVGLSSLGFGLAHGVTLRSDDKGRTVHVHYSLELAASGKEMDKTGKKPFEFRLGVGSVVKGMDIGVEGMKVGGERVLEIPSDLGYGAKGVEDIPPNADLVFNVRLVAAK